MSEKTRVLSLQHIFAGAGCRGGFSECRGAAGAALVSRDEALGNPETKHKFLAGARPGAQGSAAGATRLLTTGWSGLGFTQTCS